MSDASRYPLGLRCLHWISACLVLCKITLIWIDGQVSATGHALAGWAIQGHMSLGALLFVLTVLRLSWRLRARVALPSSLSVPQARVARISHRALYACLLALPVTGYVKLASLGYPVQLFAALTLPVLPFSVPVARVAQQMHSAIAVALLVLLVLHVTAALLHRRIDGTNILPRMGIGRP